MRYATAIPTVGLLLVTGLSGTAVAQPVLSQAPMEVTSDTPEYCLQLADRVRGMTEVTDTKPPREVVSLSDEGQRMCANGQTRAGIMRLRKALLLMRLEEPEPPK